MNLSREWHRWRLRRATAHKVTPALASVVEDHVDADRPVFQIRPYQGDGGVRGAISLLDDMHRVRRSRLGRNRSETNSHEIWHEPGADGVLSFNVAPGPRDAASIYEQLMEDLPDSEVRQRTRSFPRIPEGWHLAAARAGFFRGSVYPIRHVNIDGFSDSDGSSAAVRDPYKSVLTKVGQEEDVGVAIQTVFKPTTGSWREDSRRERASARLRSSKTVTDWLRLKRHERDPTDVERTAAKIIEQQQYAEQFGVSLRLLAWAERPGAAERRLQAVARALGQYYESHTRQGIAVKPAGVRTLGVVGGERDLRAVLRDTAARRIPAPLLGTPGEKTVDAEELAGLVHVPGEGVNHAAIDRSESKSGRPVPNRTPRFDFDAVEGVDRHSTPHDRQAAILRESTEPGDPFWLGFGARKGTEAGIFSDVLNTHAVIPGRTGVGKTTSAKNLFYQVVNRGHGALFFDPKGKDAEDFAALVPEGREDDLIYLRIGGDDDHTVGFNFMAPPGSAEPGTDDYAGALESVGDDLEAILPMASGDVDESWGTRMSRMTRNFARGFGRIGADATILDLHYALASETGRQTYADRLSAENIRFIEDYAMNHLAGMDDDTIEPLAGRVQQFVENPIVRDLVSIRDGFSVDDAIADGKIIIVEDATSSDTTGRQVAAALIRRIWVAVREQSHDADRPDPPRFFAFLDEFNEIASAASGVTEIFQDARAYNLSLIAMLQDMTTDLDADVRGALEGQTETKITYNAGRKSFAQLLEAHHSEEIGYRDLTNLSPYAFYMRTRNEQDITTNSVKVNAFAPVENVMPEAARDPEDTRELIDRRIREVGVEKQTAEEQQQDALFREGDDGLGSGEDGPAPTGEGIELTDVREARICKAVYDEAVQTGADDGFVSATDAAARIRDYFATAGDSADIGHQSRLWDLVDEVPETRLKREDRGEDVYLRCTSKGQTPIFKTGAGASGGSVKHRELLKDLYDPMTRLGARMRLPTQDGSDLPDALGTLDDIDVLEETPSPEEFAEMPLRERNRLEAEIRERFREECPLLDRLSDAGAVAFEAESSTGESKPYQTWLNLSQAVNNGQRCLFATREGVAEKVWKSLTENGANSHQWDGEHDRLYNGKDLRIGGSTMLRPGDEDETVWLRDEETGEFILRSSGDDTDLARFEDHEAVYNDAENYPATSDDIDEDTDGWMTVKKPFIATREFDEGGIPDRDEWDIIVVPANADTAAGLSLYEAGETTPLPEIVGSERQQGDVTSASERRQDGTTQGTKPTDDEDDEGDTALPRL